MSKPYFVKLTALSRVQIDALRLCLRAAVRDGVSGPFGDGEDMTLPKGYEAIRQVAEMFGA